MIEENISYSGWLHCIRISNPRIELVVTTDVGPRILHAGFIRGDNLLHIVPEHAGKTGGDEWRIYGGHRLWHAPEAKPRTYCPDNDKIDYFIDGDLLTLTQSIESTTGIQKQITIRMSQQRNEILLTHRLINHNPWDVELSVWPITMFAPGGTAIVPQEPYGPESEYLLPARSMALWQFTTMNDPAWIWGAKYVQVIHDKASGADQKIGFANKRGWCAYHHRDDLFVKCFDYKEGLSYPDFGCNNELFYNRSFIELETLGPLVSVKSGSSVEHTEHWIISKGALDGSEERVDEVVLPIINDFRKTHVI